MANFGAYLTDVESFCAMNVLWGFRCWGVLADTPEKREQEVLGFIQGKIGQCKGSRLFLGDVVKYGPHEYDQDGLRDEDSMQLCVVPYLPKKFEFTRNRWHYKCRVNTSRKYINYNSGNTVRHTIISWTKKEV